MTAPPKPLEQTWRWFGPSDPVQLSHIRQAGATGIVSSLHHIPYGQVWPMDEILKRKKQIEEAGLRWSVVESVQVHNDIKLGNKMAALHIEHYQQTIRNLAQADIRTICYNFMPVLDWSRTDLTYPWFDGSTALRFDWNQYVAFDIGILKRPHAEDHYTDAVIMKAMQWLHSADTQAIDTLTRTMLAGLPGTDEGYTLDEFRSRIAAYDGMQAKDLASNLIQFVRAVSQTAEEVGATLTIHPDDPPFSIFGLPRIMSTATDASKLLEAVPSPSNMLCFCTGSFGARADNDLPGMVQRFADRIGFVHLRNTIREADGSFTESDHLDGDSDMYAVMLELLREQQKRVNPIPFRPDHGHVMLDDLGKKTNPGYSAIGRLRGLAELRGLEMGILRSVMVS
jgi:mannonate dehydratase